MQSHPLPNEFLQRLLQIVPETKLSSVLQSFSHPKYTCLRINTLLSNRETIVDYLDHLGVAYQPVAWKSDALLVPDEYRDTILSSVLYQQGAIYPQNLSSQLAAYFLGAQPGEEVLDLCAAPGSKTLQLACMMQDHGRIAAVEKMKARFYKLRANLQHQRASCVHTYHSDGVTLWRKTPERFDRVLLDAPCSSEARFRSDQPQSYQYWSPRKIKEAAQKQNKLLFSAIQCLKPGGTLIYSTCSFAPEENEAIIHKGLNSFGDAIEVEAIKLPAPFNYPTLSHWQNKHYNEQVNKAIRILPDQVMDGFFICRIRKHRSTIER